MSCGGVRYRTNTTNEMQHLNNTNNLSSGLNGLKQMRDNFINLDKPYEDKETYDRHKEEEALRVSQHKELQHLKEQKEKERIALNRPKINGFSEQ